jgi:hypothetical protein
MMQVMGLHGWFAGWLVGWWVGAFGWLAEVVMCRLRPQHILTHTHIMFDQVALL